MRSERAIKPRVAITFREGGENGGPYISHKRVMESELKRFYEFVPLEVPLPKILATSAGMKKFINKILRINPDMVHYAGLQLEGYYVSQALLKAGIKNTLLAIHGSSSESIELPLWKKIILNHLERKTVKNSKYCFGVSEYVCSWEVTNCGNNCLGVAYNFVGSNNTVPSSSYVRKELGIPNDGIVVVSTGRIVAEKGYDLLIPICDILEAYGVFSSLYFVIVGDGAYRNTLANNLEIKSYSNNVKLLGYKKDVSPYLNSADLYWTGTKHETLGCSILEACNASLPVVASNVGGIPEVVENGEGGLLVDSDNIIGFASAIEYLAANNEIRIQMGERAKRAASIKFSNEAIVSQLMNFYHKTLSNDE